MTLSLKNAPRGSMYFSILRRTLPRIRISLLTAFSLAVFTSALNTPDHAIAQSDEDMDMDMEMEMYEDEMGMDEEMMGYGSGGRSSRAGVSTADMTAAGLQQALVAAMDSTRFATLTDPNAAPPVASGPVLLNEATVAYAKGQYALAMNLYFGHIVAEFDNAQTELQRIKYSPLMRRPAWQVRWGVSYAVRGDAVDPQPIQDTGPVNRGGFGGGGMGEGGMDMEMDMEMDDYEMEMRGGGDGRGMSPDDMAMEMEMQDDMYDEYEMEMMGGMSAGGRGRSSQPVAAPTPAARLMQLERTMLSEEAQQQLSESLGVVIDILGEEFDKRYAQGDFGRAMADVKAESGNVETVSESFVKLLENDREAMPLWRPGMVYLGQGDSQEQTSKARKAGLDLMVHFEIVLKARGDFTQNTSRCRLIHVPTGKSLGVSSSIDSLEFAKLNHTKGASGRDFVHDELTNFLAIIDRQTLTTEMPSLTAAIAKKRVGSLLASGGGANLRTLAEVRLFQSQGLLTEDEVLNAFEIVGGEEAMQLIYASEDERLRIVHDWAARNAAASKP